VSFGRLYSTIPAEDAEDVWNNRVQAGELTYLWGEGGLGKDYVCVDLVARVTRGLPMPGDPEDAAGLPGSAILITPEDRTEFTIVHRVSHAVDGRGADRRKVLDLTSPDRGSGEGSRSSFTVGGNGTRYTDDLGVLRRAISELNTCAYARGDKCPMHERFEQHPACRLVVLGPIAKIAGCSIAGNQGVRQKIIEPLQDVARDTGVAIVLTGHPTQDGKMGGSAGIGQAARLVLKIEADTANPAIRRVMLTKANTVDKQSLSAVRYTLTEAVPGNRNTSYVEWLPGIDDEDAESNSPALSVPGQLPAQGTGQRALLDLLREAGEPLSGQALSARSGIKYNTARVYLSRLCESGLVMRPDNIRGAFAAKPEAAPAPAAGLAGGSVPFASAGP
jgi:hypothetical protein